MLKRIATLHCSAVLISALAYYVGLYEPTEPYGGEIYIPFFFTSGPVAIFGSFWAGKIDRFFHEVLGVELLPHVSIVIIPGIIDSFLGTFQWYIVAKGLRWVFLHGHSNNITGESKDNNRSVDC